ncbi:MAG TPA: GGDEF domain-containing protein [Solirubrobacteraceae bacterium]|nr:GGDEF domain-containing protein [Solirubrobacteraceae bacterium]
MCDTKYVSLESSARLAALVAAVSQTEQLTDILDGLGEAVYLVDRDRTITFWNKECERVSGYSAREVVGRHCFDEILRHIDDDGRRLCLQLCPLAHTMRDGETRRCRVWLHHREGHRLPVRIVAQPIRDRDGTIIGAIESFSDDSSLASTRARLVEMERLAMVDPLTDVPNRRYLEMALSSRLAEVRRYGVKVSLAILDLDNFKRVNDCHGHVIGDAVLRMVATALAANERSEDVVARLGGDEFVIVLPHADEDAAVGICERLRMLIAGSALEQDGTAVRVTASFGVAGAVEDDDFESLMQRADERLYRAKKRQNAVGSRVGP